MADSSVQKRKHRSANTIVITMCNGHLGYIPSELGYSYNSYGANTGKFVSGTAEQLAEQYISMLNGLYGK